AGVRARGHHLGVDRVLDMAAAGALEHLPVAVDEDDVVRGDLVETEPARLHPYAAALRIAGGRVAPDVVGVAVLGEHTAGARDRRPQLQHVPSAQPSRSYSERHCRTRAVISSRWPRRRAKLSASRRTCSWLPP